jgi:hypothetical protein
MAKEYINGMDGEEQKETTGEENTCWGFGKERSKWSQVRAVILS